MNFLMDLPLYAEIAMAITTLGGLWWAGIRFVLPFLKATRRALGGLMDMGTRHDEVLGSMASISAMQPLLEQIKHEVLPNGQGSLRDAVTRTECKVNLLVGQVRAQADADDNVASLDCDARGMVDWLSRALMVWTQRTSDELKGFGWISSIHPDEREDVAEEWARCIRHKRQFDSAFRLVDRDGDSVLVRMSAMPVTTINPARGEETLRWVATLRRIESFPPGLAAPERLTGQQSRAP